MSSRSNSTAPTIHGALRGPRQRQSTLDPQLDRRIKVEPWSRPITPTDTTAFGDACFARSYAPPMQNWALKPPPEEFTSEADAEGEEDHELSFGPAQRPVRRSRRARRPAHDENTLPASSSFHSSANLEELHDVDQRKESLKLKGAFYPGMDLFDSATPEMQRKRNQKKATNVVARLEATSMTVEPDEVIYNMAGQFLKQRKISGEVDPAQTPLKGESTPEPDTPLPKKRARRTRRPRQPLIERDENGGEGFRPRRSKRPRFNPNDGDRVYYLDGSEDCDDVMTYGASRPAKKAKMSIHRDNSGPEITFENPAPMNYLTSGFDNPMHGYHSFGVHGLPSSHTPYNMTLPQPQPQPPPQHFRQRGGYDKPSTCGFRSATAEPIQPSRDLSAFGHMTHLRQPANDPFSVVANGHNALAAFQTSYAPASASSHHTAPAPQHQQQLGNGDHLHDFGQALPQWDGFGIGGHNDMDMDATLFDAGFGGHDLGSNGMNPLFFGSNHVFQGEENPAPTAPAAEEIAGQERDDDTISLSSSQR